MQKDQHLDNHNLITFANNMRVPSFSNINTIYLKYRAQDKYIIRIPL